MPRKWAAVTVALLAIAAIVALGVRGRAKDSPEKAVYALAHDIEHRDAEGVCELLFPSTFLPADIARVLDVREGGRQGTAGLAKAQSECARDFGDRGEFESFKFPDPRVRSVASVRIKSAGGVTRAALAEVTVEGRAETVKLVEYRDKWKVVFDVN